MSLELANLRQRELASLFSQQNELAARLDAVDPSSSSSSSNLVDRLTQLEQALGNLTSPQSNSPADDSSGNVSPGGSANLRRLGRRVITN